MARCCGAGGLWGRGRMLMAIGFSLGADMRFPLAFPPQIGEQTHERP